MLLECSSRGVSWSLWTFPHVHGISYTTFACFDCARNITKEASTLEAEKAHLSGALQRNGYPAAFVRSASQESKPRERDPKEAQGEEKPTLMMLPYVAGVSERIRKACRNYNIGVVYISTASLSRESLFSLTFMFQSVIRYHYVIVETL